MFTTFSRTFYPFLFFKLCLCLVLFRFFTYIFHLQYTRTNYDVIQQAMLHLFTDYNVYF